MTIHHLDNINRTLKISVKVIESVFTQQKIFNAENNSAVLYVGFKRNNVGIILVSQVPQ